MLRSFLSRHSLSQLIALSLLSLSFIAARISLNTYTEYMLAAGTESLTKNVEIFSDPESLLARGISLCLANSDQFALELIPKMQRGDSRRILEAKSSITERVNQGEALSLALQSIKGIGTKKAENYGQYLSFSENCLGLGEEELLFAS